MPRAKISDAHGLTIELEATEAWIDRRGTANHRDPNYRSNYGFAPVKAESETP